MDSYPEIFVFICKCIKLTNLWKQYNAKTNGKYYNLNLNNIILEACIPPKQGEKEGMGFLYMS